MVTKKQKLEDTVEKVEEAEKITASKKVSAKDIATAKELEAESARGAEEVRRSEPSLKYNYSVKLSSTDAAKASSSTQPPHAERKETQSPFSAPSEDEKLKKLQQSLEILKQNPAALQALQQSLAGGNLPTADHAQQKTKLSLAQNAASLASKFTASNMQKLSKNCLLLTDAFIGFIIKKEDEDRNEVLQKARSPMIFGMWVIFITFFIGGIWSAVAPLDSASHAQGFVVSASKQQVIQHKEGGILEELYVKEGDDVQAGQLLMKLSDKQLSSLISGMKTQKISYETQLNLIKEQITALETLHGQGFSPKSKLIEQQEREAQVLAHLSDLESKILTYEEQLERLSITSPIAGTVNQIQIHSIGATVGQGAILMTITPKDENLIIEAYITPQDIDSVYVGLKAKIRISAFKHRSVSPLEGVLTHVSTDVVEPTHGRATQEGMVLQQQGLKYKVTIKIDKDQLKKISKYRDYELAAGMQADVSIVTGERTLLQYLLDPILTTFWHAFKEK